MALSGQVGSSMEIKSKSAPIGARPLVSSVVFSLALWFLLSGTSAAAQSATLDCLVHRQDVIESLHSNRPERFSPNSLLEMNPRQIGHAWSIMREMDQAGLVFADSDNLIVYSTEQSGELSSREIPHSYRLRLRVLDARSGNTVLTKDLGTRAHDSAVLSISGGVLIKTGDVVKAYSADLERERNIIFPEDKDGILVPSVSPTGKTIMINALDPGQRTSNLYVFDAETLDMTYSWRQTPPLIRDYSISDQEIAATDSGWHHSVVRSRFGYSKDWRLMVDNTKSGCISLWPNLIAVGVAVARICKDLWVLEAAGMSYSLGPLDGAISSKIAVAQEGRYIAVSLDSVEVQKHILRESSSRVTGTRIAVYDLAERKQVLTVKVDPVSRNDYDFALSPDGSKLAILNDRAVSVCSVPAN